jgi:hypothetical protein
MGRPLDTNSVCVKIISLPHRNDRRSECLEELKKIHYPNPSSIFFNAKLTDSAGQLGCSLSHAMALSEFLFHDERPFVMIFEDDFSLRNEADFLDKIDRLIENSYFWDVYLLGHNEALPIEGTPVADTFRVINSLTTSGYLVGRRYAPNLINSFFRSGELMRAYSGLPSPNRELARQFFCSDVLWKELQLEHKFWAGIPSLITQRKSHSDIVNKVTDYKV